MIERNLSLLQKKNLWRIRRAVQSRYENNLTVNNEHLINYTSNDYLALQNDRRIKDAMVRGVHEFGFGSGASPHLSGYSRYHKQLEEEFADFTGRECALLFNSGYHANLGVITTLANRHTAIIADKFCHASIIDAITLSRASHHRYQHHNMDHAHNLLLKHRSRNTLLISESVFSMSGTISPADKLAALAKEHQSIFIMDDAHGFGVLGTRGFGISEHYNLDIKDLPVLITPLGKSLAGMGAIVTGSRGLIELITQKARTYCYSTALPPSICSAALTALAILRTETWRVKRLQYLSDFFNREALLRKLPLLSSDATPIKCITFDSNQKTLSVQEHLYNHGILTAAIRPPTVPHNSARIRLSLNIAHTEQDIIHLLDLLADHYAHAI